MNDEFKYFAVSEYGETTGRFHFHLLLYTNYFFDDLNQLHRSKKGHLMQYHSDFLDAYWKYGLHTISKVESDAALKYCIKYSSKSQDLHIYCSRGFGNFIHDFNNCNLMALPNSIFINANARLYNAYKCFLRHEMTKEQLYAVFKENEPYMKLKEAKKHLLTFSKLKNKDAIAYNTLLNEFTTKNMHKTNCKNIL
jgi:hypothetical protein